MQRSASTGLLPRLPSKEALTIDSLPSDEHTPAEPSKSSVLSPAMARRLRHDATLSPSLMQLRMNRQNLLNEMRQNNGKVVSQFTISKPRPVQSPTKKLPPMADDNLRRRVSLMRRSNLQEAESEDIVLLPPRGSVIAQNAPVEPIDDGTKATSDEPDGEESTSGSVAWTDEAEVGRVLESRLLSSIFRSMQQRDGSGLPRGRVVRCLEVLGYKCLDANLVEECLEAIPGDGPLSLAQFGKLAAAFSKHQRARFYERFHQIDYRSTGFVSVREFRYVLRDFGFAMSPVAMAELLDEVGVTHQMQMDWGQFEAALTNVHERFGFSSSEVMEMESLFDKYDQTGSGVLSAEELAGVMGWLGHPQSIDQAQATLARFDMAGDDVLDKLEFLLAVRQWQNEEVELANRLFNEHDKNGDGLMTIQELVTLFEKLGYTVLPKVVEEGIRTVKAHAAGLMFEEVLHLLKKLRSQECFSDQERIEFMEVFKRFDRAGRGRLRQFELARVLNWLGYQQTAHRRAELWVRVDLDKSGYLEQAELLKLLRFLREEEASAARDLLIQVGDRPLDEDDVRDLVESLGYSPPEDIQEDAMALSIDQSVKDRATTLQEVLTFLQNVRDMQAARWRENEGFSEAFAEKINSRFSRHFSSGKPVEPVDVERLLHQLYPAVRHSKEDREHLRCFISAEVTTVSPRNDEDQRPRRSSMRGQKIGCMEDLFALVRRFGEEYDERLWQREADVITTTGFSPAQVAQFREVFVETDVDGNDFLDEHETRHALEEIVSRRMVKGLDERLAKRWFQKDNRQRGVDFSTLLQLIKEAMG